MPWISTVSPGANFALVMSMRHAVRNVRPNAPASAQDRCAGFAESDAAGTLTYSPNVPSRCSPRMRKPTQSDSSPRAQNSHLPQERPGLMTTSSHADQPVTPSPTAATVPAPSAPPMWGSATGIPGMPFRTDRSRWFSAAAWTLTTTSPAPGAGSGRSPNASRAGSPWLSKCSARIGPPLKGGSYPAVDPNETAPGDPGAVSDPRPSATAGSGCRTPEAAAPSLSLIH